MKILVCVKQVPDTTEVKIDPVKELKADRDPQRRFAKIGIARGYI